MNRHNHDHFCIVLPSFRGVPTIFVVLVIIGLNLIKCTKYVIWTILSEGIQECNSSLEPGWKGLKFGRTRKGFLTFGNALEAN
jgi:hypothetical protein